ncbi:MAG: D-alanyl-D-alanine carboxypeptidase, partial [Lachnospiraceae bacterium]|nr:D-alanyl-D-alanine carboxypeptidase [Lachnospiraceae bacterium]
MPVTVLLITACLLSGCQNSYENPYDFNSTISAFTLDSQMSTECADSFACDLCVAGEDILPETVNLSLAQAEGLFSVSDHQTLVAKSVHERMNPASITKVMTCMLAIKYGRLDDTMIASKNVLITEPGAQVLPLAEGDRMTLDAALHALMMYSANDVAVMIAEYIAGSVEAFAELMNSEAKALGATNTHFVNPNGLTDEEHYTTAYDLYLIFNEAIRSEKFLELINVMEYNGTYADRDGNVKELSLSNSNAYLRGDEETPGGISVIGGKTGTTKAAGSCLILLSKNSAGNSYISVVLNAAD